MRAAFALALMLLSQPAHAFVARAGLLVDVTLAADDAPLRESQRAAMLDALRLEREVLANRRASFAVPLASFSVAAVALAVSTSLTVLANASYFTPFLLVPGIAVAVALAVVGVVSLVVALNHNAALDETQRQLDVFQRRLTAARAAPDCGTSLPAF